MAYTINNAVTVQGPIATMEGITGIVHDARDGNYLVRLDATPAYALPFGATECATCGDTTNHQWFAETYVP